VNQYFDDWRHRIGDFLLPIPDLQMTLTDHPQCTKNSAPPGSSPELLQLLELLNSLRFPRDSIRILVKISSDGALHDVWADLSGAGLGWSVALLRFWTQATGWLPNR
jgi:hypothetical protein